MTLTYKSEDITFDLAAWYCDRCGERAHLGQDLKDSERMLNRLKTRAEGLLYPVS